MGVQRLKQLAGRSGQLGGGHLPRGAVWPESVAGGGTEPHFMQQRVPLPTVRAVPTGPN